MKVARARFSAAALLALALAVATAAQSPAATASLLDRLPRVPDSGVASALKAAQARGPAGRADALWIELFYGDAAQQAAAEDALRQPAATSAGPDAAEMAFLHYVAAEIQGEDRQTLSAAMRLAEAAPDDVATELAVRALSGQIENQGRALLDAVPSLERLLRRPLTDPTTSYMLGRALLTAVHAPGLALTQPEAMQLAGRLPHWQLWGPFGEVQNLGFDQTFPIEQKIAATYDAELAAGASGARTRAPQPFENIGNGITFPQDWGAEGVDFAVTYVRAAAPANVQLRAYAPSSCQVEINGATVVRLDRRSSYTPATATAALTLAAGWNRIVVKLAGESRRSFDLMLRAAPGVTLEDSAAAPGSSLASAPKILAAPPTLASWSAARLAAQSQDPIALWVDGIRRTQDEDAEHGRVALEQAVKLAPRSTAAWLDLAEAYGDLSDASQSWAAAQIERSAQQALKISPRALPAYDRLGHVYESQGKPMQAAEQYARCAGKGYSECDWAQFHLAATQRWVPEAESALGHALAESGSDWSSIVSGLEFYSSVGDAAKLAEWERTLSSDPRAAGVFAAYQLRHGHASRSVALYQTALSFDPSSAELEREYLEALLQAGDLSRASQAAQAALAAFPNDWRIASVADEIDLRQNPQRGLASLRATDFNRNVLRHEADYVAGERFWQPWYHSSTELIKDAPGKAEYPDASSILVFDQMVDRINPDSTQDQYIHQIFRVLNATGISELGDVTTIAPGSDLITIRTIKQDGRKLLPERITNISSISMPNLEPGDYIEIEFVQHMPASGVIPQTLDNSEFFVFNSSKQPYHYSDYIVLSPPGYPLLSDQERFPSQPTVTNLSDGYTAREWLVQKTRILITEPNMPPEDQLVPKVWVSSQLQWPEIATYLADHTFAVRKATPEMERQAQAVTAGKATEIDRANAIFTWVAANVQSGEGGLLVPARQFFTDRSGNRASTFMGMLSAANIPWQLVMARPVTDDSSTKIPSMFQFQYPLVHVGAGANSADGWYDLNSDFAQVGYIAPGIRGGEAIVAARGDGAFITVPSFTSTLDGVTVTITGSVADDGDATLHLEMEFRGPGGEQIRNELANLPDANLPQIYQQLLLGNYPNGTASGGELKNRSNKGTPLVIAVDATVPNFIHADGAAAGSAWDIERLTSSVGLLRRYAPLPFRKLPLIIPGDSFEQTKLSISLPARYADAKLPAAVRLENSFGRFTSTFTLADGKLDFNRLLFLKAANIAPDAYPAFRAFGEAVDNQDRLRLTGTLH